MKISKIRKTKPKFIQCTYKNGIECKVTVFFQGNRRKKKESCKWCGNHIKTTICLGSIIFLCVAAAILTHLFIYWNKYLVKVRPDDKVMSVGAIPFPAVTICPGTRAGYPPLNFTHLLRLMQVYREPQLKLDEYVRNLCLFCFYSSNFRRLRTLLKGLKFSAIEKRRKMPNCIQANFTSSFFFFSIHFSENMQWKRCSKFIPKILLSRCEVRNFWKNSAEKSINLEFSV